MHDIQITLDECDDTVLEQYLDQFIEYNKQNRQTTLDEFGIMLD